MSIVKVHTKRKSSVTTGYKPVCDGCEEELYIEDSYDDAVESMQQEGWKRVKEDDGWKNYCKNCRRLL